METFCFRRRKRILQTFQVFTTATKHRTILRKFLFYNPWKNKGIFSVIYIRTLSHYLKPNETKISAEMLLGFSTPVAHRPPEGTVGCILFPHEPHQSHSSLAAHLVPLSLHCQRIALDLDLRLLSLGHGDPDKLHSARGKHKLLY